LQIAGTPARYFISLVKTPSSLANSMHWHRDQKIGQGNTDGLQADKACQQTTQHSAHLPLISIFQAVDQLIQRKMVSIRGDYPVEQRNSQTTIRTTGQAM